LIRLPDATLGRSVPVSVARSLSSGHLNLSQPDGSRAGTWAKAGIAANNNPSVNKAERMQWSYRVVQLRTSEAIQKE
jgi:hypothetical protein